MFHLALQSSKQLPSLEKRHVSGMFDSVGEVDLIKYSEVEVVVVVSNGNVAAGSHPNTNREVGDALPTYLPQIVALVVEHLDAVSPVVADEHLLVVVHCHTIGEFKMPRV